MLRHTRVYSYMHLYFYLTRNSTKKKDSAMYHKYDIPNECDICMSDKQNFFKCEKCENKYCRECHKTWKPNTCPFCRCSLL